MQYFISTVWLPDVDSISSLGTPPHLLPWLPFHPKPPRIKSDALALRLVNVNCAFLLEFHGWLGYRDVYVGFPEIPFRPLDLPPQGSSLPLATTPHPTHDWPGISTM